MASMGKIAYFQNMQRIQRKREKEREKERETEREKECMWTVDKFLLNMYYMRDLYEQIMKQRLHAFTRDNAIKARDEFGMDIGM